MRRRGELQDLFQDRDAAHQLSGDTSLSQGLGAEGILVELLFQSPLVFNSVLSVLRDHRQNSLGFLEYRIGQEPGELLGGEAMSVPEKKRPLLPLARLGHIMFLGRLERQLQQMDLQAIAQRCAIARPQAELQMQLTSHRRHRLIEQPDADRRPQQFVVVAARDLPRVQPRGVVGCLAKRSGVRVNSGWMGHDCRATTGLSLPPWPQPIMAHAIQSADHGLAGASLLAVQV